MLASFAQRIALFPSWLCAILPALAVSVILLAGTTGAAASTGHSSIPGHACTLTAVRHEPWAELSRHAPTHGYLRIVADTGQALVWTVVAGLSV